MDLKNNITKGILGFKVSTVLLQPTAALNAIAYVNMTEGKDAALHIAGELAKAFVIPSYKKDSLTQSQALQLREGSAGNVDLYEMKEMNQRGYLDEKTKLQHIGNTIGKASMAMIQEFDLRTASAVRNGMYNYYTQKGMSVDKAAVEADFIMSLTQSSTQITDRPLIIAEGGDFVRMLLIFQTYTMGLYGLVQQGIIKSGVLNGKNGVQVKAALALISIPFFQAAAQELVKMVNLFLQGKDDDEDWLDKVQNILIDTPLELLATIPLLGSVIKGKIQYNRGYSNPATDIFGHIIEGAEKIWSGEDLIDKLKGVSMEAEAIATAVGIPGSMQAFDFINRLIKDDAAQKKDKLSYYSKQVNNGSLTREEAFEKLTTELYPFDARNNLTPAQLRGLKDSFKRSIVLTGDNRNAKMVVKESKVADKAKILAGLKKTVSESEFQMLTSYLRLNGELSENVEEETLKLIAQ